MAQSGTPLTLNLKNEKKSKAQSAAATWTLTWLCDSFSPPIITALFHSHKALLTPSQIEAWEPLFIAEEWFPVQLTQTRTHTSGPFAPKWRDAFKIHHSEFGRKVTRALRFGCEVLTITDSTALWIICIQSGISNHIHIEYQGHKKKRQLYCAKCQCCSLILAGIWPHLLLLNSNIIIIDTEWSIEKRI